MAEGAIKTVSMERTKAEKKAAEERCTAMPCDGPDFPWGLNINLGKDELDKLGITKLPEVGAEMKVYAVCCVTRVSQSASQGGNESKGVELQIVQMGVEPEADEPTGFQKAAGKLYK